MIGWLRDRLFPYPTATKNPLPVIAKGAGNLGRLMSKLH